ncbi:hypothetical protein PENTCL1PPCAC_15527, partial [Pristionchus entomophagus]
MLFILGIKVQNVNQTSKYLKKNHYFPLRLLVIRYLGILLLVRNERCGCANKEESAMRVEEIGEMEILSSEERANNVILWRSSTPTPRCVH